MAEMLKYIILKYSLSSIFLSRYLYFISYTILRSTFQTTSFFLSSIFGCVVLGYKYGPSTIIRFLENIEYTNVLFRCKNLVSILYN